MRDPIAYTYEADHHCEDCASERFDRDLAGDITGEDSEGNEVGALFSWDEWHICDEHLADFPDFPATLACGTCGDVIEECVTCEEIIKEREAQEELDNQPADVRARRIASEWHPGMMSALYALTSTGATELYTDEGMWRIRNEIAEARDAAKGEALDLADLVFLADYVEERGPRGPVEDWSGVVLV